MFTWNSNHHILIATLLIISSRGESLSELQKYLTTVLKSRTFDPGSPCSFLAFMPQPGLFTFEFKEDTENLNSLIVISGLRVLQLSQIKSKFNLPCLHAVTWPGISRNSLDSFVKQVFLRYSQDFVHFIFVEKEARLLQLFKEPLIQALKYKTGLSTSNKIVIDDSGFVRTTAKFSPLPSENFIFRGKVLTIQLFAKEPFVILDAFREPIPNTGIGHKLALMLSKKYNFTYTSIAKFKPFNQHPNGTWRGVMFDLTEGDTDILFSLGSTHSRFPAVSFTTPTFSISVPFYTSHTVVRIKWQALAYPLKPQVWACLIFVLSLSVVTLYLQLNTETSSSFVTAIWNSTSIPLASLLQQNVRIPKESRFIASMLLFLSLVITTAYTCNLVSFLSFPHMEPVPRTFNELVASGDYKIYLYHIPGGSASSLVKNYNNSLNLKLRAVMTHETSLVACIKMAAVQPKTACISYDSEVGPSISANLTLFPNWSPLLQSSDTLLTFPVSAVLKKRSRYQSAVNSYVGIIRDCGLIQKWRREVDEYKKGQSRPWMRQLVRTKDHLVQNLTLAMKQSQHGKIKPFSLNNYVLCFGILILGLVLSCFVFLTEARGPIISTV